MKYLRMKLKNIDMNNLIKIGIPSKGRLRNDILNIFKKKKLKLSSEKGKRDLVGYISGKKKYQNYLFACKRNNREFRRWFPRYWFFWL